MLHKGLPRWLSGKESACSARNTGCLSQKDPLEKGMATHSSILAWRTPWTEEPGRLQSTASQRVRHTETTLACTHALHIKAKENKSNKKERKRKH